MANSATARPTYSLAGILPYSNEITATTVVIDTTDTDLTVVAGVSGKRIAIIGFISVIPSDATVTIKGASNLVRLNLGSKSGPFGGHQQTPILVLDPGDSLVIRSSAAINESEIQTIFI